jgi:demethylmenaquinone methyltransferase/2-methoxy-6-polyprenyl-1,4-benzoquinol methylase
MDQSLVREQIAYYRAQAREYRRVDPSAGPLAVAREHLLKLGPLQHILELAPGTGDWTQELVRIGQTVTALEASPEMIAINRERVADPRVEYQQADLFQWTPQQQYDLVFFAFWLSHVPPDLVDAFLLKVRDAVRPGGHLFIIDQCNDLPGYPLGKKEGIFEERTLSNGRTFTIVKVFYHPGLLAEHVKRLGFDATAERVDTIFYLNGTRLAP